MVLPSPWGAEGPRGPKHRQKQPNPHRSHEICAETNKMTRQGSRDPSDHPGTPEKQGLCDCISGTPVTAKVIISDPSEYQGPSDHQGPSDRTWNGVPLTIRGLPNCQGPYDHQGPSRLSGNCQAPLNIRDTLMGRFKLGGP